MGEAAKALLDKAKRQEDEEQASLRRVNGRLLLNPLRRAPTPAPITGKRG